MTFTRSIPTTVTKNLLVHEHVDGATGEHFLVIQIDGIQIKLPQEDAIALADYIESKGWREDDNDALPA